MLAFQLLWCSGYRVYSLMHNALSWFQYWKSVPHMPHVFRTHDCETKKRAQVASATCPLPAATSQRCMGNQVLLSQSTVWCQLSTCESQVFKTKTYYILCIMCDAQCAASVITVLTIFTDGMSWAHSYKYNLIEEVPLHWCLCPQPKEPVFWCI